MFRPKQRFIQSAPGGDDGVLAQAVDLRQQPDLLLRLVPEKTKQKTITEWDTAASCLFTYAPVLKNVE
jgi:hypothetical protein